VEHKGEGGLATDKYAAIYTGAERKKMNSWQCLWTSLLIVFLALQGSFTLIQNIRN